MQLAPLLLFASLAATQTITNAPAAPGRTSTPTTMITFATGVDFDMGDFALDELPNATPITRPRGVSGTNPITVPIGVSISVGLKPRTARAPVATQY